MGPNDLAALWPYPNELTGATFHGPAVLATAQAAEDFHVVRAALGPALAEGDVISGALRGVPFVFGVTGDRMVCAAGVVPPLGLGLDATASRTVVAASGARAFPPIRGLLYGTDPHAIDVIARAAQHAVSLDTLFRPIAAEREASLPFHGRHIEPIGLAAAMVESGQLGLHVRVSDGVVCAYDTVFALTPYDASSLLYGTVTLAQALLRGAQEAGPAPWEAPTAEGWASFADRAGLAFDRAGWSAAGQRGAIAIECRLTTIQRRRTVLFHVQSPGAEDVRIFPASATAWLKSRIGLLPDLEIGDHDFDKRFVVQARKNELVAQLFDERARRVFLDIASAEALLSISARGGWIEIAFLSSTEDGARLIALADALAPHAWGYR